METIHKNTSARTECSQFAVLLPFILIAAFRGTRHMQEMKYYSKEPLPLGCIMRHEREASVYVLV